MAKYKTQNNLQDIWNKLDDACGSIDNALIELSQMNLPENVMVAMEHVDFSAIVNLNNELETLLEQKR